MLDVVLLLAFLIVLVVAFRATTPEDRARLPRTVLAAIQEGREAAIVLRSKPDPFREALRARTPLALVTPAVGALWATIFVFMVFGGGAFRDPQTLVGWGGNFGPRTTNGEWWRLVTSTFVHSGMLQLLVNMVGFVQVGLILERLVGPLSLAAVYVAAAVFAGLVSVSTSPMAISVGASGSIFGLYGMLLAGSIWGMFPRSNLTITPMALKKLGPAAVVFILYSVAGDGGGIAAQLTGLVAGFVCGLVLTKGINDRQPPTRRVGITMAATAVIAAAFAFTVRGITDVRPEIARVVAVEDHTAGVYKTAADRFRSGRLTAEALSQLIDGTIMPELQAAEVRLEELKGVPPEHKPLVADAEEYLRLRCESWRLRAEALRKTHEIPGRPGGKTERPSDESWRVRLEARHKANMLALGRAESTERASLEAFAKIRPTNQK